MLRIIDMRDATNQQNAFAVWNTVDDRFVADSYGDECFAGFQDFARRVFFTAPSRPGRDVGFTARVRGLLPQWAFLPDGFYEETT